MAVRKVTVAELFERKRSILALELVTADCPLNRTIDSPTISSPGLLLAGFYEHAPQGRIQVLGETEVRYLQSLESDALTRTISAFLALDMPAIVVTKNLTVPQVLHDLACERGIPILRSAMKTGDFYRRIQPYLEERFAPTTQMHGSLADVYGVGLLFIGRSGIGKSECVLDLVERGHRLVADDLVMVSRMGNDILIGRGHEKAHHHMEIRGVGIIDIQSLFGIRAIRQQKRIEVVVQLVDWSEGATYDRTGLNDDVHTILDVDVPRVIVPLNAGKNITVVSEVVAMNHLLRYSGVDSARLFDERLRNSMRPVQDYLEQDYE